MTGEFARSLMGHDKGKLYIIVDEDEKYCYLCDGRLRMLDNPKKKKLKHIQQIHKVRPENFGTDDEIKRAIRLYEKQLSSDVEE